MPILHVDVKNKKAAYLLREGEIVCGNKDYKIQFTFDEEWEAYPIKTARFVSTAGIEEVIFEGDTVNVPAIHNSFTVLVGVYAGDLHTTTAASIPCQKSILCQGGAPADPAPDVYAQLMEMLQAANPEERISALEEQMDDLLYAQNPFTIKSFTNDVGTVEIGSTVEKVTLKWVFNREPESVLIGPYTSDAKKITPSISGSFEPEDGLNLHLGSPGTRKWKILAKHEKDDLYQEKTTTVTFANRIWYGAAEEPEAYDGAFVKSLSKNLLQNSKPASITVNAGAGKYIWYCQPERLGSATFTFGANEGGVSYITGVSVENDSGYTERYSIYRSDNPGLGNTTLGVK